MKKNVRLSNVNLMELDSYTRQNVEAIEDGFYGVCNTWEEVTKLFECFPFEDTQVTIRKTIPNFDTKQFEVSEEVIVRHGTKSWGVYQSVTGMFFVLPKDLNPKAIEELKMIADIEEVVELLTKEEVVELLTKV